MPRRIDALARRPDIGAILGTVAVVVVFTVIDFSGWWSPFTQRNITQYTALLGLLAIGQAFVIFTREIDLSVGSVYGLSAVAFIILEDTTGILGAFVLSLGLAAAVGWLNAVLVTRARMASMIVTLSALFVYRGVIYVWTGGTTESLSQAGRVHWLTQMFGGRTFGIEHAVFWLLAVLIVAQLVLQATRFGNRLQATGGDPDSAHSRGVDVRRTKTAAFIISSVLAGLSGVITVADEPRTHVTLGQALELEAIAAAVVGGCLLAGGRGSMIGAVLGAFIITSVRYELIGLGAPSSWFITFVGFLLIVAVVGNKLLGERLAQ